METWDGYMLFKGKCFCRSLRASVLNVPNVELIGRNDRGLSRRDDPSRGGEQQLYRALDDEGSVFSGRIRASARTGCSG